MPLTPKEYLDRYTSIVVKHPLNGTQVTTGLTGYGSGWGPEPGCNRKTIGPKAQQEFFALKAALQKHLSGGKGKVKPLPKEIYFKDQPLGNIPALEAFYPITLINSFVGKGSPDEIRDTLRLAIALGRAGGTRDAAGQAAGASTVAEYMERFLTLDCNGLVGNYYGLSGIPNISVGSYAVAGRRRKTMNDVRQGDCVVTHSKTRPYEHIALVELWQVTENVPTKDMKGTVFAKLVEWGQAGGEDKHYTGATAKTIKVGPGPEKTWGVGFEGANGTYRYVFAPPPSFSENNGWPD